MNRRSFFKRLAVGAAVVAVTPSVLEIAAPAKTITYSTYIMGSDAILNMDTIRAAKKQLMSSNVTPFKDGQYAGVIHPSVYADLNQ